MISCTIFCSAQAAVMRRGTDRTSAIDLTQPIRFSLDDVEHLLAEDPDHLLGVDRADTADHAGGEILLDVVDGTRRRGAHEARLELLTMGAVVYPSTGRGGPFSGCGVADDCEEVAMPARLDPKNTEAILGVVVSDTFDDGPQDFLD